MGKATGFIDYERKTAKVEEPLERIRHFREFRTPLPLKEQQKQGARCLRAPGQYPLFPGIYMQGLPGSVRGGLYLQPGRRAGGHEGEREGNH